MNLYSKLCEGRNYICIEKIKNILSYDSLNNYLWNPWNKKNEKLDQNIKAAVASLLTNIYIDIKPRLEKKVPQQVFFLSKSKNQKQNLGNVNINF